MDEVPRPSFLHPRDPSIDRRFRPCPKKQTNLDEIFEEYEESDVEVISSDSETESISSISTDIASIKAVEEGAVVYLRLKPVDDFCEYYRVQKSAAKLITSQANGNEKQFIFSEIFDGRVTQREVYDKCVKSRIDNDESFTVMSYGTSGSGKTFTLIGSDDDPGILPRSLEHIFKKYARNIYPRASSKMMHGECVILSDEDCEINRRTKTNLLNQDSYTADYNYFKEVIDLDHNFHEVYKDNCSIFIWVSFVEIYNENVFDLLQLQTPNLKLKSRRKEVDRKTLKVISNKGNVYVKDLTSIHVKTAEEAYHVLRTGLKGVTYADTGVNANSSRSHFVFMVEIITYSHPDLFTTHTYRFCDLAGSERQTKTNCAGSRLKEAQQINKSLVVLGRCLDTANNNITKKGASDVIPVRESKLTMLLQPALLGKEKLCMIVALTPLEQFYEENMNVLNYASVAKNIVFKSQKKKETGRRFSWLTSTNYENRANDHILDDLMHQNTQLLDEKQELMDQLIIMKSDYDRDMTNLEDKLRKELNEYYRSAEDAKRENWMKRLELEKKKLEMELNHRFKEQIEEMQDELDDQREEILDLKADLENEKKINDELTKKIRDLEHKQILELAKTSSLQRKLSPNVLQNKENHF